MKLLYNTITQKLLPWPRIDDSPIIGLEGHLLEMEVIQESKPIYNSESQYLEPTEIIDINNCLVTRGWEIIQIPTNLISPEVWVGQHFTSLEVIALMRLEQAILSQGKTLGPKMEASKQWLEAMMFAQPSISFPVAPFSYAETSAEAAQTLTSN